MLKSLSIALLQFYTRLKLSIKIIFKKDDAWVFISIGKGGVKDMLSNSDIDINVSFHRMQEYNMWSLIKKAGEIKTDEEMESLKQEFEALAKSYSCS